jgi:hypothetical protein
MDGGRDKGRSDRILEFWGRGVKYCDETQLRVRSHDSNEESSV